MVKNFIASIQDEEGNLNSLGMKICVPLLIVCILIAFKLA